MLTVVHVDQTTQARDRHVLCRRTGTMDETISEFCERTGSKAGNARHVAAALRLGKKRGQARFLSPADADRLCEALRARATRGPGRPRKIMV